jgi:hypothetical protein
MRGPIRSVLFALAVVGCLFAVGASSAMAKSILEAKGGKEGAAAFVPLRDDLTTAPSNAQYGADILTQNTKAALALTVAGVVQNRNATNYAFVGLKLHSNPEAKNCSTAVGYVEFADFQNAENSAGANSPVYSDTLIDPWRFEIRSDMCATNPGKVTIYGTGFWFPVLATEVRGTITGVYEQPGVANCTGGGVKLDLAQPLLTINGAGPPPEAGISNNAGGNAFLCFVSANNYLYPTVGKELGPLTGEIKKF